MDVLHHHLEAVEAASLGDLYLSGEALSKVLQNNTVRGSKESKDVLDKVLLIFLEFMPILHILTKVDFIDSPEACHLVFIHLPDIVILDW